MAPSIKADCEETRQSSYTTNRVSLTDIVSSEDGRLQQQEQCAGSSGDAVSEAYCITGVGHRIMLGGTSLKYFWKGGD